MIHFKLKSGKLHNLARAVADEETEPSTTRGEGLYADQGVISNSDKDIVLGLGLRVVKQIPLSSSGGESGLQSAGYDIKDSGKRIFAPLSGKPMTYLSQFILHVAAIGDIVDGTDTTHDFNFFSIVYEWPKDVRFSKYLNYLTVLCFRHDNYHDNKYFKQVSVARYSGSIFIIRSYSYIYLTPLYCNCGNTWEIYKILRKVSMFFIFK